MKYPFLLPAVGGEKKQNYQYLIAAVIIRICLPEISHKLNEMCEHYGIPLDHHQAASDSHACAEILLRYIDAGYDVNSFIRTYRLEG